jgi:hypothetical protein
MANCCRLKARTEEADRWRTRATESLDKLQRIYMDYATLHEAHIEVLRQHADLKEQHVWLIERNQELEARWLSQPRTDHLEPVKGGYYFRRKAGPLFPWMSSESRKLLVFLGVLLFALVGSVIVARGSL